MVRSAYTALALAVVLSLFGPSVSAQEATTHVVAAGETLEFLAGQYLGDRQRWPEIARLNPDVTDPDRIEVGLRLSIPGSVMGSAAEPEKRIDLMEASVTRASRPGRSVFYGSSVTDRRAVRVQEHEEPATLALPKGVFYSAEWVEPGSARPAGAGTLGDFVTMPQARRFQGSTARPFDRIALSLSDGFVPQEGQHLQVYRIARQVQGLGWVMRPTGAVTVVASEDGTAVVQVDRNVAPMSLGDLVRPVPRFPLRPGQEAQDVELGSVVARIVEWGEPHQLPQYGDIAFLDVGSRDGVSVGDEFVIATRTEDGSYDNLAGRVQVVFTTEEHASARVIQMDGPVFSVGVEVFLARKMR